MSSNTLRGIGQEGGGGEDDAGSANADSGAEAQAGAQAGESQRPKPETEGERAEKAGGDEASSAGSSRMPELRRIRSLDSTVPGTRSLDSSVPEAQPSLDAKVPNMAATLLGLPAPVIVGRTQGTVQGRDVHLPQEAQRNAELRAVAGVIATSNAAAPRPQQVATPAPSFADPLWIPTNPTPLSQKMTADGYVHGVSNSDPGTNPWYDDDLARHRVYEDKRPNLMGRVAIGAAAAAALAVILFAYVRLSKVGAAVDEVETRANTAAQPAPGRPALPSDPAAVSPEAPARPAGTAERGLDPRGPTLPGDPTPTTAPPATRPGDPSAGEATRRPPGGRPSGLPSRPAASGAPSAGAGLARPRTPSSTPPPAAESAPPPQFASPPVVAPPPSLDPPPLARQPAEAAPPPATSPAAPPPSATPAAKPSGEKRGKPSYDPDSTLPLNID